MESRYSGTRASGKAFIHMGKLPIAEKSFVSPFNLTGTAGTQRTLPELGNKISAG
jgi:hypothetical protein